MPNLKDIRVRISSVKTTRQVTSAMKMVSAAKFKKSHDQVNGIRPYVDKLSSILLNLVSSSDEDLTSKYSAVRDADSILFVAITSNRGLCGAFNSNIVKQVESHIKTQYKAQQSNHKVDIIAIGKQGQKMLKSHGYNVIEEHNEIYSGLDFKKVSIIAESIIGRYLSKKYDRVIVVYNGFVNAAMQNVSTHQFLPLAVDTSTAPINTEYYFEPDKQTLLESIIPKALKSQLFKWLIESVAAEHGARMTSMHKATDNATELIGNLQLQYNKARQTAITNEILEIVSGANAQSK